MLTTQEDLFCLGVIEYAGNLRFAYRAAFGEEERYPEARARELMVRPEIVTRIHDLMASAVNTTIISESAHMTELAELRDLAKAAGQPKTALQAEMARGQVAGYYKGKVDSGLEGLDIELVKSASKLKKFVDDVSANLAGNLPV